MSCLPAQENEQSTNGACTISAALQNAARQDAGLWSIVVELGEATGYCILMPKAGKSPEEQIVRNISVVRTTKSDVKQLAKAWRPTASGDDQLSS